MSGEPLDEPTLVEDHYWDSGHLRSLLPVEQLIRALLPEASASVHSLVIEKKIPPMFTARESK